MSTMALLSACVFLGLCGAVVGMKVSDAVDRARARRLVLAIVDGDPDAPGRLLDSSAAVQRWALRIGGLAWFERVAAGELARREGSVAP